MPRMIYRHDPEGHRLPIKLDSTSNGESMPRPLTRHELNAIALAHDQVGDNARRTDLGRRAFMVGAKGAATTLMALNEAAAAVGQGGGGYVLPPEAGVDEDAAASVLGGDEFVFDVQNHAISPTGAWRAQPNAARMLASLGRSTVAGQRFAHEAEAGELDYLSHLDGEHYVKDVFLDSDTQMAVMSVLSTDHDNEPLPIEEAARVRALVDRLGAGRRLLLHGKVLPNAEGDLKGMDALKRQWNVAAWKLYTQLPSTGSPGYRLDDEAVMTPFIERSRALGVKVVCAHKGLPFGTGDKGYSTCRDVGGAARLYPDMNFIVYHGGYDHDVVEGAYDPDRAEAGINALVRSLIDNGIAPGSNVYAELGASWRAMLAKPDQAAHAWGKLLKYVGEDNILWGTDCIWYGSPQDQIQAFRAFQISGEFQDRYGYPELTKPLKARIFGLNAARIYGVDVPTRRERLSADALSAEKLAYSQEADPAFVTHGPKTADDFIALNRLETDPLVRH